jgi:hypothetical protein
VTQRIAPVGGPPPADPPTSYRLDDPDRAELVAAFRSAYLDRRCLPHVAAEYARAAAAHALLLAPAGCGEFRGASYVFATDAAGTTTVRVFPVPLRRVLAPALLRLARAEGGAA